MPSEETLVLKLSCPLVHPGVCVTDDADTYESLDAIAIGIEHQVKKPMKNTIFRFISKDGAASSTGCTEVFAWFAHHRQRRAAIYISHVFVKMVRRGDSGLEFEKDVNMDSFMFLTPYALAKIFVSSKWKEIACHEVHLIREPGPFKIASMGSDRNIYPHAFKRPYTDPLAGLKCKGGGEKTGKSPGLKIIHPRQFLVREDSEDCSSGSDDGLAVKKKVGKKYSLIREKVPPPDEGDTHAKTHNDDDTVLSTLVAKVKAKSGIVDSSKSAATLETTPTPTAAAKAEPTSKKKHGKTWGPFWIAEIRKHDGSIIGWGATCKRHHNVTDTTTIECKKQITMGKKRTADECRRLCKAWLVMGLIIDDADVDGRRKHVFDTDLDSLQETEEESEDTMRTICGICDPN